MTTRTMKTAASEVPDAPDALEILTSSNLDSDPLLYENGVSRAFVARCQKSLSILMAWAQMDIYDKGRTDGFFAVVTVGSDGAVLLDSQAATLQALGWSGCSILGMDQTKPLLPDQMDSDESNQVMIDLASQMDVDANAFVIRVTNDVNSVFEGLTPEGAQYLKNLKPEARLGLPGVEKIWTVEFLSPGNRWYCKSSHPVHGSFIYPSDFITAMVDQVKPSATQHNEPASL